VAAGRLESIEPVGVFGGVLDAHERPDHCLQADAGQDLFTGTSMVFANDRHVRVAMGNVNGLMRISKAISAAGRAPFTSLWW
jgi:hypothetical protein